MPAKGQGYAEIRVIDAATGLGVQFVELEPVNNLKFVTDSAGRGGAPGVTGWRPRPR